MKRFASLCLILCLLLAAVPVRAERIAIPDALRFTQKSPEAEYVRDRQFIQRTYPVTANEQVNAAMRALIDQMADTARPYLPTGKMDLMPSYLDVGSTISRTGSQWMSFLTIARIAYEREQTYVDFDARVYDMETGSPVALTDLFAPDSEAWALMADAVRQQLGDYFMTEEADPAALDALCSREALENTPFTLTPAKLELHFRADALYPGKSTLMHAKLYYSAPRPLMTALGQQITDNSQYKMIALTFDDGGARGATNNLLNQLRRTGANATFFIVGTMMYSNHDVMCRQQDAGYAMASHNFEHVYNGINESTVREWSQKFDQLMDSIVGIRPEYMRAPGGMYGKFIAADANMPLIQWSINSSDSGNENVMQVAQTVINNARDGGVALMHDLNPRVYQYAEIILADLEARNYLCVTVDELFDHYGVPLEPNQVYYGCEDEAKAQK
ncbi:MAG: polysaccharide deacetylase family protein [Clostridia bacterium]|nr:polysaccharide deacetylase family protein [Clostridia bacterium]